jgi:hypothetical protein
MIKTNINIENARIGFRNFTGKEGKFNAKGNRNFCVFLEDEVAIDLEREGWNIRWLMPKDDYDAKQAYLSVSVSYGNIPPNIFLITSKGKTLLNEESIMVLDWAEISNVDLTIRPYNWDVSGKTGVKAYIKSMYVTITEDSFESKYRDVPDSAVNSMIND